MAITLTNDAVRCINALRQDQNFIRLQHELGMAIERYVHTSIDKPAAERVDATSRAWGMREFWKTIEAVRVGGVRVDQLPVGFDGSPPILTPAADPMSGVHGVFTPEVLTQLWARLDQIANQRSERDEQDASNQELKDFEGAILSRRCPDTFVPGDFLSATQTDEASGPITPVTTVVTPEDPLEAAQRILQAATPAPTPKFRTTVEDIPHAQLTAHTQQATTTLGSPSKAKK